MKKQEKAEALATIIVLINKEIESLKRPTHLDETDNTPKVKSLEYYVNRFTKRLEKLV